MALHGHKRDIRRIIVWTVAFGVIVSLGGAAALSGQSDPATQVSMRSIFATLSRAYGYSLDPEYFDDEKNRQEIMGMLEALDSSAERLEAHGGGLDPSFDYHRRSLSRDAGDALMQFKLRNHIGSRFILSKMTENCITCHTKLPAERRFDLGAEFIQTTNVQELPNYARVNLEIATRQFDAAAMTYEDMLASPDMKAADYALYHVFERYLKLCVGALDDPGRAAKAFRAFAARADMPADLKKEVEAWADDLEELDLSSFKGTELTAARTMIESAVDEQPGAKDRHFVDYVAAGALLHRYLATRPTDNEKVAEAYYLLGVSESHVARSYWISEVGFLLESAIRTAPKSEAARDALAYLEAYTQSAYRVEPARTVPPELETNLEELRALVEN